MSTDSENESATPNNSIVKKVPVSQGTSADRAKAMIDIETIRYNRWTLSNIGGDKLALWKFTSKCLGPECLDGVGHLGQAINLKHYLVTVIDQEQDETGVLEPAIYVVLHDGVGQPIGFWSPYVCRDLGRLIATIGTDDFGDGVRVKVVESSKQGKRKFYGLVAAD